MSNEIGLTIMSNLSVMGALYNEFSQTEEYNKATGDIDREYYPEMERLMSTLDYDTGCELEVNIACQCGSYGFEGFKLGMAVANRLDNELISMEGPG